MCLYPKLIKNPKYKENNKNKGNIPLPKDTRTLYVPIGCGNCIECRKQKKREWQTRLNEELKNNENEKAIFITLTFKNEELKKLETKLETTECNGIATYAVRKFLERWRKENKKSIKHWLITELGHNGTERIHLHGIIWTNKNKNYIEKKWKYGQIWVGTFCNEKTINYIIKYVTKIDTDHKGYKPIILTSKGIGKRYINTYNYTKNKYKENNTDESYKLRNGYKTALPIYYRNYIYTEEEREKLWIEKINKKERYINGIKIDISTKEGIYKYNNILKNAQEKNIKLGYGDRGKKWNKKQYNTSLKQLNGIKDS